MKLAAITVLIFLFISNASMAACKSNCLGDVACEVEAFDCYAEQKSFREAIDHFKQVVEKHPDEPAFSILLAKAYRGDGNDVWAERTLLNVLDVHPDHCEARSHLAWLYIQLGELSLAEESLIAGSCPVTPADKARLDLVLLQLANIKGDTVDAKAHEAHMAHADAVYPEDKGVYQQAFDSQNPDWIDPLQLRFDVIGGFSSNATAGSPSEKIAAGGESSGIIRGDLFAKVVLPMSKTVRPTLEGRVLSHFLGERSARELSYLDLSARPGLIFSKNGYSMTAAYKANLLLMNEKGKERFLEAHRGEFDFETDFGLLLFGGAGRRIYAENGRTRTEMDGGVGGTFKLHPKFLLLAALSMRRYFAIGDAYDQAGTTLLAMGQVRLIKGMLIKVGASGVYDRFPNSGGKRGADAFGIEDKREDIGFRQFDEIVSPSVWDGRLTFGIRYEFSLRNSTADKVGNSYEYREHRALASLRLRLSANPFGPKIYSPSSHVPLDHGMGLANGEGDGVDERIQDLIRQDEATRAGSACVD